MDHINVMMKNLMDEEKQNNLKKFADAQLSLY